MKSKSYGKGFNLEVLARPELRVFMLSKGNVGHVGGFFLVPLRADFQFELLESILTAIKECKDVVSIWTCSRSYCV